MLVPAELQRHQARARSEKVLALVQLETSPRRPLLSQQMCYMTAAQPSVGCQRRPQLATALVLVLFMQLQMAQVLLPNYPWQVLLVKLLHLVYVLRVCS